MGNQRRIGFDDLTALAAQRDHLAQGGLLIAGCDLPRGCECELELVNPAGGVLVVTALVAWSGAEASYLALRDTGPAARAALAGWLAQCPLPARAAERDDGHDDELERGGWAGGAPSGAEADDFAAVEEPPGSATRPPSDLVPVDLGATIDLEAAGADADAQVDAILAETADPATGGDDVDDGDDGDDGAPTRHAPPRNPQHGRSLHERLRGLTSAQAQKIARQGELHQRTILERIYGKAVWETLLRNPRLTHPEVIHLARMGSMPRPLLELLVGNGAWLQSPQVRRALLANPRLSPDQVERVLRHVPKNDLKLIASQTVYPIGVRHAAKRLLGPPAA